jgi:hypothetical protein
MTDQDRSVQSSRALGVFALSAVILAAISFAAVDVIIANAGVDAALPADAIAYGAIGTIALLSSIVPAFTWFVRAIDHPHHEADIEPMPMTVSRLAFDEEEL